MSFTPPTAPTPGPAPAPGSDLTSYFNYSNYEEQYNTMMSMAVSMNQDYIQSVGGAENEVSQTGTTLGEENIQTTAAKNTATAKDADEESQSISQA